MFFYSCIFCFKTNMQNSTGLSQSHRIASLIDCAVLVHFNGYALFFSSVFCIQTTLLTLCYN